MKAAILLTSLYLCSAGAARAAGPGTSTADFLNIDVGARQAAMGGAAAGLADDSSALYYNPAGLGTLLQGEFSFSHMQWVSGIDYEYGAYAHPTKSMGTFAGQFSIVDYGSISSYDEFGAPLGNTSASDRSLAAGWGSPLLGDRLHLGLSAKYISETLASYSASALAADAGALISLQETPSYSLRFGAGARNLGPGLKFASTSNPLPQTLYGGFGLTTLDDRLAADLDGVAPRDDSPFARLGLEYRIHPMVALRAGYSGRSQAGTGLDTGAGLQVGRFDFDYAFSDMGSLGFSNRVQVTWKFGGKREKFYQNGRDLMAQGRYAEAILQFNKALQLDPADHRAMLRIKECSRHLAQEQEELNEK